MGMAAHMGIGCSAHKMAQSKFQIKPKFLKKSSLLYPLAKSGEINDFTSCYLKSSSYKHRGMHSNQIL